MGKKRVLQKSPKNVTLWLAVLRKLPAPQIPSGTWYVLPQRKFMPSFSPLDHGGKEKIAIYKS